MIAVCCGEIFGENLGENFRGNFSKILCACRGCAAPGFGCAFGFSDAPPPTTAACVKKTFANQAVEGNRACDANAQW
jgi:hypothetical protein